MDKTSPGLRALGWSLIWLVTAAGAGHTAGAPEALAGTDADTSLAALLTAAPLDRPALIAAVLARNPSLEEARQTWIASRQREPQARSLDQPTASYGLAPLSISDAEARFGQRVEIAQRLPWAGKRRFRGDEARARSQAVGSEFERLRLDIALEASRLFDRYYLIARASGINAEHIQLLEEFQRIATSNYAAGIAPLSDPLQAEVEVALLAHRDLVLQVDRKVVRAKLNRLLHRAPSAPLPPPPLHLAPVAADGLVAADRDRLTDRALEASPDLAGARAEIQAEQAAVALAELARRPDFKATTSYTSMWNTDEHRWMVGLGATLPLWRGRIAARATEASGRLAAAESRRQRLEDEVRLAIEVAADRLEETLHVVSLYENRLLPAAHDQVRAATSGYETGSSTFLTLIEAEKNLRSVDLGYEQTLVDRRLRHAELMRALGALPIPVPTDSTAARTTTANQGALR